MTSSSLSTTVLRPSRAAYGRAFKANLWIAIPLLAISLVRIGLNPWLLPVFVVVIGLSLGGVILYFSRARVEFGEPGTGESAPPAPQLILTHPDGSKLLRLRGQTWEVEQFTVLANDLIAHGVHNDAILEPITTAQLRLRYPRVVGWWEAHPIAFGLILGIGIVVVAMMVVVAVFAAAIAG